MSVSCRAWVGISTMLGILSMSSSNCRLVIVTEEAMAYTHGSQLVILLLRLWVLWERRLTLINWTLFFYVLTQAVTLGMAIWAVVQAVRE